MTPEMKNLHKYLVDLKLVIWKLTRTTSNKKIEKTLQLTTDEKEQIINFYLEVGLLLAKENSKNYNLDISSD